MRKKNKYVYKLEGKNKKFNIAVGAKDLWDADDKMEEIINGNMFRYDIVIAKKKSREVL